MNDRIKALDKLAIAYGYYISYADNKSIILTPLEVGDPLRLERLTFEAKYQVLEFFAQEEWRDFVHQQWEQRNEKNNQTEDWDWNQIFTSNE